MRESELLRRAGWLVLLSVLSLVAGLLAPPLVGVARAASAQVRAPRAPRVAAAAEQAQSTPPAGGEYVPVTAFRIVDTRSGLGGSTLGPGGTDSFTVTGVGAVPPSGVSSVVLNVTAVNATADTFLTAFPSGAARPTTAATLNDSPGVTASNLAFVQVGSNGQVSVYNNAGSTDLVVDVEGYVTDSTATAAGSTFASTPLVAIADTRSGLGVPKGPLGAGQTVQVTVGGTGGVPASGVTAVVLNVTAANPTAPTFLTVWRAGDARPNDGTVTAAGQINVSQTATVPTYATSAAAVDVYNNAGSTDVIVSVEGYFLAPSGSTQAATFVPVVQQRVLDTRDGTGGTSGPIGAGGAFTATVTGPSPAPAGDVSAAVLNITTTQSTSAGYLTAWATGSAQPSNSLLNMTAGVTVGTLAIVPTSSTGQVSFYVGMASGASTQVLADVAGYFVYAALTSPLDQARVARTVDLGAVAASTYGYVDYLYRDGPPDAWTRIGLGQVEQSGQQLGSWPLQAGPGGAFPTLVWHAADTLGTASGSLQVEACVSSTSANPDTTCTAPSTVQITPHAFDGSWATASLGPGTLSLVTGDYQLSAADAAVSAYQGSLSAGRVYDTVLGDHLSGGQQDVEGSAAGIFTPGNATVTSSTAQHYSGAQSLQITPATGGATNDTYAAVGPDLAMALTMLPGHSYRFTSYVYVPSTTGLPGGGDSPRAERPVAFVHSPTAGYTETDAPAPTATNTWQPLSVTFTVPTDADQAFVRLYNGTPTGSGLPVYYDHSSLTDVGVYGPGWRSALPGPPAGAGGKTIIDRTDSGGYVILQGGDGSQDIYQETGANSSTVTYTGLGDAADGSVLTKNLTASPQTFTLTDLDGTVTTWWLYQATWQVQSVAQSGAAAANTTTYTWDASNRISVMTAPSPPEVTCPAGLPALAVAGCRSLSFTYAAVTTATGTGSGQWGNYQGQLQSISYVAADPAQANTMRTTVVAAFTYDSNGLLRQVSDPRLSPPLTTTYSYDPTGRLLTVTPPGLASWTLGYDGSGRLTSLSRPDPSGQTATSTIAYDLPLSGSGLPDLSAGTDATWGQSGDDPITGTAVFRPDHVPAVPPGAGDWPYATVHYQDVNGRETDTADYGGAAGWNVAVKQYDQYGNVISSLTADNRAQALNPTAQTDAAVAAMTGAQNAPMRAAALSTLNAYSGDGVELLDTLGPTHPVTSGGQAYDARAHTHTVYSDQDGSEPAHTGPAYRLPTTITTSAQTGSGAELDMRTTINGYAPLDGSSATSLTSGWTLRMPTTVTTVMPGGTNLVKRTVYNSSGQPLQVREPADANGTTAATTVTTYYSGGLSGNCVSNTFAGMPCTRGPAAQPTGTTLPTSAYTYDYYGKTVTATDSSGGNTRTTTMSYDAADRPTGTTITGGQGTATPATTISYDPNTGLQTSTADSAGATIATGYDNLARPTSYTDANSNTSHTTYDLDGRQASLNDGKGNQSDTYEGADANGQAEDRGLLTKLADSAVGTFAAAYDGDGKIIREVYPSGLTATWAYDNAGEPTSLTYAQNGQTWQSYTATYNAHGQMATAAGPLNSQAYGYDADGRLTETQDTYGGTCTTRDYGYDLDTNRTALTAHPASGGVCSDQTSPTSSASHSYNTGDQLVDDGYAYDAYGRTLTAPAGDLTGTGDMSLGYFTDGMVAGQAQNGTSDSFTLDPLQNRTRTETINASGHTLINHYTDSGDSPAWTDNGDGTWTRNVPGIDGNLAATESSTGTITLQLPDLHGNIGATAPNTSGATGPSATFAYTEFGTPEPGSTPPPVPYGMLGAKQRSTQDLGGLTLMGLRLYDPQTGRFLQVDPVPGGNANPYDYCNADPVNCTDLTGKWGWHNIKRFVKKHWKAIALVTAGVLLAATGIGLGVYVGGFAAEAASVELAEAGSDLIGLMRVGSVFAHYPIAVGSGAPLVGAGAAFIHYGISSVKRPPPRKSNRDGRRR